VNRRQTVFLALALLAALVVFAAVQDRVTAAAARRYVAGQRAALRTGGTPLIVDDVMRPAIDESVREGAMWGGGVLLLGVLAAVTIGRR
jgi:hypothetical protein